MGRDYDGIYGDQGYEQYGYPIWREAPMNEPVVEDFQMKWPHGYWEEYDRLMAEARRLSGDPNTRLIMKLNGKFQVRTKADMFVHSPIVKYVHGPEMGDRLEAWAAFIDSISTAPVRELTNLAGKALKINMSRVKKGRA